LLTATNAKGNSLARQLKLFELPPERCAFEMVAVGPLFPEQNDMKRHRVFRDKAAALERALADHLREAGHTVIGTHSPGGSCDERLRKQVCRLVDEKLKSWGAL
jgi:hypothetical protein